MQYRKNEALTYPSAPNVLTSKLAFVTRLSIGVGMGLSALVRDDGAVDKLKQEIK